MDCSFSVCWSADEKIHPKEPAVVRYITVDVEPLIDASDDLKPVFTYRWFLTDVLDLADQKRLVFNLRALPYDKEGANQLSTKSVGELIDNVAQTVTVVLVSLMIAVVGLNVFCRYFIGFSWAWGEELPRYSMVWIAFLGGSVGVKQGQMMAVNYLVDRIPYSIRCFVIVVSLLSSCTFLAFAIFYGILITGITYKQVSPALRFPMSYAYVVVPLGCSIMLYHILTQLVEVLKKKRARIPVESQEIEEFSFRKNKQN